MKKTAAFLKVEQFLEDNDDEQITVTDLRHKLCQFLQEAGHDREPYAEKHLKQKLEGHFGDTIIVTCTCIRGKANVMTFRSTAVGAWCGGSSSLWFNVSGRALEEAGIMFVFCRCQEI